MYFLQPAWTKQDQYITVACLVHDLNASQVSERLRVIDANFIAPKVKKARSWGNPGASGASWKVDVERHRKEFCEERNSSNLAQEKGRPPVEQSRAHRENSL
jgi:hypothetical protein